MGAGSFLLLGCKPKGGDALSEDGAYVTAETAYGKVRGIRELGVNIFKGIPYAGSVSGEHRFGRPAPLKAWSGVRDALQLGTPAMQLPTTVYGKDEPAPGEDCLFLNVWTPANDGAKRPVVFYNHGGGYATGSGGSLAQDGANLARHFDVVVVETNHRLNIFGFLYLGAIAGEEYATSGNNGILDIVEGLKWVKTNIAQFGGDPDNVMICGESGGGYKTSILYGMPAAAPYFNKASIESGPGLRVNSLETAAMVAELTLKELGIAKNDWRKLFEVPAEQLFTLQGQMNNFLQGKALKKGERFGFAPVVDQVSILAHPFVPAAPALSKEKPVMVGWNADEYIFFLMTGGNLEPLKLGAKEDKRVVELLRPQYGAHAEEIVRTYRRCRPEATASELYVAITSIAMMGLGSIEIAEKKTRQGGAPAYLYNFCFEHGGKVPGTDYPMSTPHAMDITYKFDNAEAGGGLTGDRPERMQAAHAFASLWTSFARNGRPGTAELPEWPAYDLERRAMMRIDVPCSVVDDPYREEREMWTALGYIEG